jgi:hypothetical protein
MFQSQEFSLPSLNNVMTYLEPFCKRLQFDSKIGTTPLLEIYSQNYFVLLANSRNFLLAFTIFTNSSVMYSLAGGTA